MSDGDSRERGQKNIPRDIDLQEQEFYARSLLSLIDNGKGDFLIETSNLNTEKLKTFAVASIYVISQSAAVNNLEHMPPKALVNQIPNLLEMTRPKRKDQKLRMIYNSIFKMIVNKKIKHARQNFPSKFDIFLNEYPPEQRDDLKKMLVSSKAPSKKKLKVIFGRHPEIREEFHSILEQQTFLKEYLGKRLGKSEQIYRKFHELYKQHGDNPVAIAKTLGSTFKAFPWSISEIRSSCDILFQITIECLVQAKKNTSLENQMKSSLQAMEASRGLGKRSPGGQGRVDDGAVDVEIIVPEVRQLHKSAMAFQPGPRPAAFHPPSPPPLTARPPAPLHKPLVVPPVHRPQTYENPPRPTSEGHFPVFSFVFVKDLNPYIPWKPQHSFITVATHSLWVSVRQSIQTD